MRPFLLIHTLNAISCVQSPAGGEMMGSSTPIAALAASTLAGSRAPTRTVGASPTSRDRASADRATPAGSGGTTTGAGTKRSGVSEGTRGSGGETSEPVGFTGGDITGAKIDRQDQHPLTLRST